MPQFPWNELSPLCIVSDNLTWVGGSISLSDFLPLIPNSVQKDRLNKYACVASRPSHFLNLHGWCLSSPETQTRVRFIRKHSWFNISFLRQITTLPGSKCKWGYDQEPFSTVKSIAGSGDFPGGLVTKTVLPMHRAWVQSLVRELDSIRHN